MKKVYIVKAYNKVADKVFTNKAKAEEYAKYNTWASGMSGGADDYRVVEVELDETEE